MQIETETLKTTTSVSKWLRLGGQTMNAATAKCNDPYDNVTSVGEICEELVCTSVPEYRTPSRGRYLGRR